MNSLGLIAIALSTLVLGVFISASLFDRIRRSYYTGVNFWGQWFPVLATGTFLAVIAISATGDGGANGSLKVGRMIGPVELGLLFVAGLAFLSRIGNFLATGCVAYLITQTFSAGPRELSAGAVLMVGCATVVAVLGDRMPWLGPGALARFGVRTRDTLGAAITIVSLALIFAAIVHVHGFGRWLGSVVGIRLPVAVVLIMLIALFIGWLAVALGFARHFTIALLSLPSFLVTAYTTDWPSHALVVPFAIALSLSIAAGERRILVRRIELGVPAS